VHARYGVPVSVTSTTTPRQRAAVIGGGWAGLAAAVRLVETGHAVTLFDMAPQLGGRARSMRQDSHTLDNGQHILIGAYRDTLALMRKVGVDVDQALMRAPLALVDVQGLGLKLPLGHPVLSFARGVLAHTAWPLRDRISLLRTAAHWRSLGFVCDPSATVGDLTQHLPASVQQGLIQPLCVAALNTPADVASGTVFLRVLRDALFSGRGSSDLLLPRQSLAALLPQPAQAWLEAHGAHVRLRARVQSLQSMSTAASREPDPSGWLVDGERFDGVVLACSALEAARLVAPWHAAWSSVASRVPYQSIVTVYLYHPKAKLQQPMVALNGASDHPAQFVFDLGVLTGQHGLLAFVISGANAWLAQGLEATTEATLAQANHALGQSPWVNQLAVVSAVAERRATFACSPLLARPSMHVAERLVAAGDHVQGPYPSTLEGAVRSGQNAADALFTGPSDVVPFYARPPR
jgi:hydroxysqualene dehydroxylase